MKMGSGRNKKSIANATSFNATPEGRLSRHIRSLELETESDYLQWCRENGFEVRLHKSWESRRLEEACFHRQKTKQLILERSQSHLASLGCSSEEDYFGWLSRHKLKRSLEKSASQKSKELRIYLAEKSKAPLAASNSIQTRLKNELEIALKTKKQRNATELTDLQRAIVYEMNYLEKPLNSQEMKSFQLSYFRLLNAVFERSRLLNEMALPSYPGLLSCENYISGLASLAFRHKSWVRQPEDWKPTHKSPYRQFHSLANHLLAQYEVPAIMDSCWFVGIRENHIGFRSWFEALGSGKNLRSLQPQLTKRAAHLFGQAPKNLTISEALRWCQVRSFGGSRSISIVISKALSKIANPDDEFWKSAIFFVINHPEIQLSQIVPLFEFFYQIKFETSEVVQPDGYVKSEIEDPDFSLKGRNPANLLARMKERKLRQEAEKSIDKRWEPLPISPLELKRFEDSLDREVIWKTTQLLTTKSLKEEGDWMGNCVSTYAHACLSGNVAIWRLSAERRSIGLVKRLMTIEVNREKLEIVQARGRFNQLPGDANPKTLLSVAPEVLKIWAKESGLTICKDAMLI